MVNLTIVLKIMNMRKYIPIIILLVLSEFLGVSVSNAQEKSVVIKVEDNLGKPISDATILYNEGAFSTKVDHEGTVKLSLKNLGTYIRAEAENYVFKIIAVDSLSQDKITTVTLKKSPFHLGENNLIEVPFGQLERRRVVGAISVIKSDEVLQSDNNQNVLGAIGGRVAGVYGNRDIRGLGNAVVVIDGIPRSASDDSDRLNFADEINLLEVDEISVLKDATSKILYGAKADQGVVLIKTKRGEAFKRKLNIYGEYGARVPISFPQYLSAADYMTLYNEALTNDGLAVKYSDEIIEKTRNKIDPVRYPDESFFGSDYLKDYSPSFKVITQASGGNLRTKYFSTLGFTSSGNLQQSRGDKSNATEQINFRGNVDYSINKWISASIDAVAVYFTNRYPNGYFGDSYNGNVYQFASEQLPNSFPTLIPIDQVGNKDLVEAAKLIDGKYLLGGTSQFQNNILGNLMFGGQQSTQQKSIQFNTGLKFDLSSLAKGLTANAYFTYDFLNAFTLRQNNEYAVYEPSYVLSSEGVDSLVLTKYGTDVKKNNQTINNNYFQRRYGVYGTVNYKNTFNSNHHLDVTLLSYMNAFQTGTTESGRYDNNRTQHFGARANYMFRNKYVGEFSGAYVGSPYLSEQNRYAFSPSVGAAWILSEEDFMKQHPVVNYLKLKTSYGLMNSDQAFSSYRLYEESFGLGLKFLYNNLSGNGNSATQFVSVPNPDLTFVKRKELNIGIESSLLKNKLWFEANYFNSRSEGEPIIRSAAYTAYLGGFLPTENYNISKSNGVEAELIYTNRNKEFQYSIGTNMVYVLPQWVKFNEPAYTVDYRYKQGKVSDARFGYVAEGLFKDLDDIANHAVQTFGDVKPGDIKYKDLNNDGVINEDDQMLIGNSHARFQYGLNVNLNYKNLSFFVLGIARFGGTTYYNDAYYWVYGQRKYTDVVLDRWTPETAASATYPRLTTGNGANNFRNSTYWLYNNDFFTLNTAQLTYSLPAKYFWKGMRIYMRGNNLFTISKTKDRQELNTTSSSPQMRSYTLGLVGLF